MTPNETGIEQLQKIISCWPSEGTIEPYKQKNIRFICKSKVNEELEEWTKNYAICQKQ